MRASFQKVGKIKSPLLLLGSANKHCSQCAIDDKKEDSECSVLKCGHRICLLHLKEHVVANLGPKIRCFHKLCTANLKDSIIRSVLSPSEIEKYERLCLQKMQHSVCCALPQCGTVVSCENKNTQFECQRCSLFNCVSCQQPHSFQGCAAFNRLSINQKARICETEKDRAHQILARKLRAENRKCLIEDEESDLLGVSELFTCELCCRITAKDAGVKLRSCFHQMCKNCLADHISSCPEIPVVCPFGHNFEIEDREIVSVLSQSQLSMYRRKTQLQLKKNMKNPYNCKTPNCEFFCELGSASSTATFSCPTCGAVNCVACQAVHSAGESCVQYKGRMKDDATHKSIQDQIEKGQLMKCPDCHTLLKKIDGCDWIICIKCRVELCWIRQMRRWGPKGYGDTSGGCKCGVGGIRCHQRCGNCH